MAHHRVPQGGPSSFLKPGNNAAAAGTGGGTQQHTNTPGKCFLDRVRNVIKEAVDASAAGEPSIKWSSPGMWGDTPTSAELARISEVDRNALRERQLNGGGGGGEDDASVAKPKQLSFVTPTISTTSGSAPFQNTNRSHCSSGRRRRRRRQPSLLGLATTTASTAAATLAAVATSSLPACSAAAPVGSVRPRHMIEPSFLVENAAKRQCYNRSPQQQQQQQTHQQQPPHLPSLLTTGNHLVLETHKDAFDDDSDDERDIVTDVGDELHCALSLDVNTYLPPHICAALKAGGGPQQLYEWQAQCLNCPGGHNLVYCAPTSGGKSLVAEILMLRRLMHTNRPALLVLPFISLCAEKSARLRTVLEPLGKDVRDFYGPLSSPTLFGPSTGVIVCTIEKANTLINRLLEDSQIGELSCVVIDELHMVGDEDRGYQLELLLTKLRYAGSDAIGVVDHQQSKEGCQVVGMSATLPNVQSVATWLGAKLFETSYRPVVLRQFVKVGNAIKDENGAVVRTLGNIPSAQGKSSLINWNMEKDPDHVAWLTDETVCEGHSVLIFCGTRGACETTAEFLTKNMTVKERSPPPPTLSTSSNNSGGGVATQLPAHPTRADILAVLASSDAASTGSTKSKLLLDAIAHGIAFHHAGLLPEERELVEIAFKCGAVSVLCATSTLAVGMNLPARRVIFRHAWIGRESQLLDATRYRQMAGRAGRAGIDSEGESYLIAQKGATEPRLLGLMRAAPAPIGSCLTDGKRGMKRAMLEVVASGAVTDGEDVKRYVSCTLLAATSDFDLVVKTTIAALTWLGEKSRNFIYWDKETEKFQPTPFGKAALGSGLSPELCIHIRDDLAQARQAFVLSTDLYLTYLCVPATETITPNYSRFHGIAEKLSPEDMSVMEKVGIPLLYLSHLLRQLGNNQPPEKERVCRRFWIALLLADLLQEMPVAEIHEKYGIALGDIQGLQERACRSAGMLAVFCERMQWHGMHVLMTAFQARVLHGVKPEILTLMEIPFVKSYTARLLYSAGLKNPEAVAVGGVKRVFDALCVGKINKKTRPAAPQSLTAQQQQQQSWQEDAEKGQMQQQAGRIVRAANEMLRKRAEALREEAAAMLQMTDNNNNDGDDKIQQNTTTTTSTTTNNNTPF